MSIQNTEYPIKIENYCTRHVFAILGYCPKYCLRIEIDLKQGSFSNLKLLVTNNFETILEMS